jgi:DNA-binding HxlR family transcriptional regulator
MARKWLVDIVWALGRHGECGFTVLKRTIGGRISARLLAARLRELAATGLVERRDHGTKRPSVSYRLTPDGQRIDHLLRSLERRVEGSAWASTLQALQKLSRSQP